MEKSTEEKAFELALGVLRLERDLTLAEYRIKTQECVINDLKKQIEQLKWNGF